MFVRLATKKEWRLADRCAVRVHGKGFMTIMVHNRNYCKQGRTCFLITNGKWFGRMKLLLDTLNHEALHCTLYHLFGYGWIGKTISVVFDKMPRKMLRAMHAYGGEV